MQKAAEWGIKSDKIAAGVLGQGELDAASAAEEPIEQHIEAFVAVMRARPGRGGRPQLDPKHVTQTKSYLYRIVEACGFARLRDVNRPRLQKWVDDQAADGLGARTSNAIVKTLVAFVRWAVETNRLRTNPLQGPPLRDEKANPTRPRRGYTDDELERLFEAARKRGIAECGRQKVPPADNDDSKDLDDRRRWPKESITFETLPACFERGLAALAERPERRDALLRVGRERALVYAVLADAGLRCDELRSRRVRDFDLTSKSPCIRLDAASAKSGKTAVVALSPTLAAALNEWASEVLRDAQSRASEAGGPLLMRLDPEGELLRVPEHRSFLRTLDHDLAVASIPKIDEHGRRADLHSFRVTTGTRWLRSGVAFSVAQAHMRLATPGLLATTYNDLGLGDTAVAATEVPALPLGPACEGESPEPDRAAKTGTDGRPVPDRTPAVRAAPEQSEGSDTDLTPKRAGKPKRMASACTSACATAGHRGVMRGSGGQPASVRGSATNAVSGAPGHGCTRQGTGGKLACQDSNLEPSDPESDVLPVAPQANGHPSLAPPRRPCKRPPSRPSVRLDPASEATRRST